MPDAMSVRSDQPRPSKGLPITSSSGQGGSVHAPSAEQIAARWDTWSHTYDRWGPGKHPAYKDAWIDALAELLGHPQRDGSPVLRIADIGTGTGDIALLLAEMGHDVTGYDISPVMLERARAKAGQAGVPAAFDLGDAYHLPLGDGSFDAVVNRLVLWTLHDPSAALLEWWRVVSPGGHIVVIDGLLWADSASLGFVRRAWRAFQRLLLTYRSRRRARRECRAWGGAYYTDTVATPGMSWRSVVDAQAHFTEAGLPAPQLSWLDALFEVERRTTPVRRRLVSRPRPFFALTVQRPRGRDPLIPE
jgi:ubiquinone/menaquinone biosynthesis C-methylase UbiE